MDEHAAPWKGKVSVGPELPAGAAVQSTFPEPSAHGVPTSGTANNEAWSEAALAAMRSPDAECCVQAYAALSAAIFNEKEAKAHAGDAGALFAIVEGLGQHVRNPRVQLLGLRCARHLCFRNPLACASAPSVGAIAAMVAAIDAHPDRADVKHEAVWALSTLSLSYEKCLVAASRSAYDALQAIAHDATGRENPKAVAIATFLLKKIHEWRCGGNR
mmetsp:Transcript_25285/g.77950  ORF Transcript_25285/g.77950 Transcript_25285/m.77950 type:complete len:216 (-) Transcript_25285:95-742(-)